MKKNETSEIEVLEMYAKFLMIVLIIAAVAEVFVLAPKSLGLGLVAGALTLVLGYLSVCLLRVVCEMARDIKELKKK